MRHKLAKKLALEQLNALYDEMRDLSAKLKFPFPEAFLRVHHIKRKGMNVVRDVLRAQGLKTSVLDIVSPRFYEKAVDRHSESYVRNAYNAYVASFGGVAETGSYDDGCLAVKAIDEAISSTTDILRMISDNYPESGFAGEINDDEHGILIGTDTTAESFDDYKLLSMIAHGGGEGQMNHFAGAFTEGFVDTDPDYYWSEAERLFDNDSGGSITVGESVVMMWPDYIVVRDVWSPTIAVGDGEGIAVTYEFRVTYPTDRS